MPTILAIETATARCSVALVKERNLLAECTLNLSRSHATHLPEMVQEVLRFAETEWSDVTGIAVSVGPGSYTGLRIGVSTAKAIAFAHEKPLVGINSLHGLAQLVLPIMAAHDWVCPLIDARRDEVYTAAFRKQGGGLVWERETIALTTDRLYDWLLGNGDRHNAKVWLVGDGAAKSLLPLQNAGLEMVQCLPDTDFYPNARAIAACVTGFAEVDPQTIRDLEPFYYKAFTAAKPSRSIRERTPQS